MQEEFDRIKAALSSNDTNQRKKAVARLVYLEHPKVFDALELVAREDPDPMIREQAIYYLENYEFVSDATNTAPDDEEWICEVCAQNNPAVATFCSACASPKPQQRSTVIQRKRSNRTAEPTFFLHAEHEDFVKGRSKTLHGHKSNRVKLTIGMIFLAVGLSTMIGVLAIFLPDTLPAYELAETTTSTTGTITGTFIDLNPATGAESYVLTYEYTVADITYQTETIVETDIYDQYDMGDTVEVFYVPSTPDKNRITEADTSWESDVQIIGLGLLVGAVVEIIGLGFLYSIFAGNDKTTQLEKKGRVVKGEIISADSNTTPQGEQWLTIQYQFVAPDTQQEIIHTTRQKAPGLRNNILPNQGTPVRVVYVSRQNFRLL